MNSCLENIFGFLILIGITVFFFRKCTSYDYQNTQISESIVLRLESNGLTNIAVANFEPIGKNYYAVGEYLVVYA